LCQLCDVVLTSGHRRIPAHKLVLSAASDHLAAILASYDASSVAVPIEVNVPDVDSSALDDVINYIYTGECMVQRRSQEFGIGRQAGGLGYGSGIQG